jgi:hypothetical protein
MSEPQLMNDEAARSTTGEILDQATAPTETKPTETKPTDPSQSIGDQTVKPTTTADPKPGETLLTEPKPEDIKAPVAGAPEAYADFKAPEGYIIDKVLLEAALPAFKELNLTQDQAQRLVDIQVARELALAKAPQETYENLRKDWRAKVTADTDIRAYTTDGKTGIDAVKIDISRALGTLDPTLAGEFRAAMDLTGAGDHPAFVKAFWKLSQGLLEGKPVTGRGPSPAGQVDPSKPVRPSPAAAMYPNLPSAG